MGKLTAIEAKALTKPGRYTDGDGLHLHVRSTSRKTWVLRFMRQGKLRDMGLGAFPGVTLAKAREKAAAARVHISEGGDPIEIAQKAKAQEAQPDRTFKAAAGRFIKEQIAGWRNAKHGAQWASTLDAYAYPVIGDMHVREVSTQHVLEILRPIWSTKPETASRVRGRIEAVLDAAKALHWRVGENPARWKGHLALLLPPDVPGGATPLGRAVRRGRSSLPF